MIYLHHLHAYLYKNQLSVSNIKQMNINVKFRLRIMFTYSLSSRTLGYIRYDGEKKKQLVQVCILGLRECFFFFFLIDMSQKTVLWLFHASDHEIKKILIVNNMFWSSYLI